MAKDELLEYALLKHIKRTHGVERIICTTKDCANIAARGYGLCFVCVEGVMRSAREQIERLRGLLAKYGGHKVGCCTGYDRPVTHPEDDCDCGWHDCNWQATADEK